MEDIAIRTASDKIQNVCMIMINIKWILSMWRTSSTAILIRNAQFNRRMHKTHIN